ncbi:MAG TPA: radical SAM protein, partial [Polyangiaceae bacterium]
LATVLVSDGNSTPEALGYMRDVTDVFRVDVKGADDGAYKKCGGRLSPVLDSLAAARRLGYWTEAVTLWVPGLNQDLASVRSLARTLREIDPELVWHLNAFVPRYRLSHTPAADPNFLVSAAGTAYAAGLRFVYVGNVAALDELSHTRCPDCHYVLIRRRNYETLENRLDDGRCPQCARPIPGLWERSS